MTKPKPAHLLKKNQKAAPKTKTVAAKDLKDSLSPRDYIKPAPPTKQKKIVEALPFTPDPPKATLTVEKCGKKPAPAQARKEAGFRLDLLDNWMGLNAEVKDMSEAECEALINHERENRCRPNVILRLHGRFNKLRGLREKQEWMRGPKG